MSTTPRPPKYVNLDAHTIRNSDRLVAVFSQRRDGTITFAIHREFDKMGDDGKPEVSKTAFCPEDMSESYLAITKLAIDRIAKLKIQRRSGGLPFPEGGHDRRPHAA